jgi:hypothetical protein
MLNYYNKQPYNSQDSRIVTFPSLSPNLTNWQLREQWLTVEHWGFWSWSRGISKATTWEVWWCHADIAEVSEGTVEAVRRVLRLNSLNLDCYALIQCRLVKIYLRIRKRYEKEKKDVTKGRGKWGKEAED